MLKSPSAQWSSVLPKRIEQMKRIDLSDRYLWMLLIAAVVAF